MTATPRPLLSVRGLSKRYDGVPVLDAVDLDLAPGETLGIVGPSGSGKSTLARLVMRLIQPDAGTINFEGRDLLALRGAGLRALRPRFQMVFQDPLAALNPRATVARALDDPLRIHTTMSRQERAAAVSRLLERVGLPVALGPRGIHEISGGQRQRVAIARAIATRPSLLVLDEALSALDMSVRSDVMSLLLDLQREQQMAYLFISHDLALVSRMAHRVAVMDAGRIVETGSVREVIGHPASPMAKALVAAAPRLADLVAQP